MHDDVHWRWFPGMSQEAQIVVGSPNGLPTDLPKVNPTLHHCRHAEAAAPVPRHRIWADGVAIDTLSRPHNQNASLVKKYFSERIGLKMKIFRDTDLTPSVKCQKLFGADYQQYELLFSRYTGKLYTPQESKPASMVVKFQ